MNLHTSILSTLDLSTDSPSHNTTATITLCPHCSQPTHTPALHDQKLTDALREAQERVTTLEKEIEKGNAATAVYRKRLEKTKEKSMRLFLENENLTKEVDNLKDSLKQAQTKCKELQIVLSLAKKQVFQRESKDDPSIRDKTPDRPSKTPDRSSRPDPPKTPTNSNPKEQHYLLAKDRSAYVGQMVNGVPHGRGRLFIKVGLIYEGEFRKHRIEGFGTMRNLVSNEFYEGQWRNGKRHGKGLKILGNVRYEGEFKDDVAEGWGEGIDLKTGKKYIGQWKNDRFQGDASDSLVFHQ